MEKDKLRAESIKAIDTLHGQRRGLEQERDRLRAELAAVRENVKAMRVAALVNDWPTFDAEHDAALEED